MRTVRDAPDRPPPAAPPGTWRESASCRGADVRLFFPDSGLHADAAKSWCRACPVRAACLDDAMARGERWGVWGGLTEKERRRLRRARREVVAAAS